MSRMREDSISGQSILRKNSSTTGKMAQHEQDEADAEARRWWSEREAKAEKDMTAVLHKRMEMQRTQIHAFKLEQSKWEHELQLRISKYSHDRKLLSEHNIELQEELMKMEERTAKLQRENDLQAAHLLELEGQLRDTQDGSKHLQELQAQNEDLQQRVIQWESKHNAAVAAAVQRQESLQSDLIVALEQKLKDVMQENERLRDGLSVHPDRQGRRSRVDSRNGSTTEGTGGFLRRHSDQDASTDSLSESVQCRITELEKACKQKDQAILSLKSMLERHEAISDEKATLIQAKYDQIKAINISLQRKLLQSLTDAAPPAGEEQERNRRSGPR